MIRTRQNSGRRRKDYRIPQGYAEVDGWDAPTTASTSWTSCAVSHLCLSIGNGNACKLFRSEFMDRNLFLMAAAAAIFAPLHAQTFQRSASMRGSGNGSGGKCTIEVVVDEVAEVEI